MFLKAFKSVQIIFKILCCCCLKWSHVNCCVVKHVVDYILEIIFKYLSFGFGFLTTLFFHTSIHTFTSKFKYFFHLQGKDSRPNIPDWSSSHWSMSLSTLQPYRASLEPVTWPQASVSPNGCSSFIKQVLFFCGHSDMWEPANPTPRHTRVNNASVACVRVCVFVWARPCRCVWCLCCHCSAAPNTAESCVLWSLLLFAAWNNQTQSSSSSSGRRHFEAPLIDCRRSCWHAFDSLRLRSMIHIIIYEWYFFSHADLALFSLLCSLHSSQSRHPPAAPPPLLYLSSWLLCFI